MVMMKKGGNPSMRISVSISPIWRKYNLSEPEIYRALKACGFDYADYDFCPENADNGWKTAAPKVWADNMKSRLADIGITLTSAHVSGINPAESEENRAAVTQAVLCAAALGIENIVIPLGTAPNNSRAEYNRANIAYLSALLPIAEDAGVTLLLEHAGSHLLPHHTHYALELEYLLGKLNYPDRLKISLNTGHMCVADIQPYTEINILAPYIRHVDASDAFGSMPLAVHPERETLGFAPLMGYADFDAILQGLCEANYDGFFNLRMNMPRVFEKNSPHYERARIPFMPQALTERLYTWSLHAAQYMLSTYNCLDA